MSGAVAEALLGYYGQKSGAVASELAHLFEAAREFARAAEYYLLAARNAVEVFAHKEAATLARRGLDMLKTQPETPERARQELGLQLTLGFALGVTEGYAALEAGKSMTRAREICQQLGESPQLFPAIWGLFMYYFNKPDFHTALQMGEQLLRLAQSVHDPILLIGAHGTIGITLLFLGDLAASREHLERAIALHDPQQNRAYFSLYRLDPGFYCRCQTVRLLWLLGYPEQSRRLMHETLSLAQENADPRTLAYTLLFAAMSHQLHREAPQTQERAEVCIAHCQEYGIAQERAWVTTLHGWALAEQGRATEGIAEMREGIAALRAMHSESVLTYYLALLAEALGKAGQTEEGLAVVDEGLSVSHRTGECYYEAELYRLKGELLLKTGEWENGRMGEWGNGGEDENISHSPTLPLSHSSPAAWFRQAIAMARKQQAKSFELRAAMSLARLLWQQGRAAEARDRLATGYSWFTEGFDTADLKAAQALLAARRVSSPRKEVQKNRSSAQDQPKG